jgi:hypothetical protein
MTIRFFPLSRVTWYCVTVVVVIAFNEDMLIAFSTVIVPVVDTGVLLPPLIL